MVKPLSENKERLRRYLKSKGMKSTRQREIIADEFFKAGQHITTDELYKRITRKHKDIGYTTVYRTLKLLRDSGLAVEQVFTDNITRYEPMVSGGHHDHLICLRCGSIREFEDEQIEKLQDRIARRHGFRPISHRMELYGYCKKCSGRISP